MVKFETNNKKPLGPRFGAHAQHTNACHMFRLSVFERTGPRGLPVLVFEARGKCSATGTFLRCRASNGDTGCVFCVEPYLFVLFSVPSLPAERRSQPTATLPRTRPRRLRSALSRDPRPRPKP